MKRIIFKLFTIPLVFFTILVTFYMGDFAEAKANGNNIDEIRKEFLDPNGRILSTAHRGCWRGYSENSIPAFESCIDKGVDMVEIDIQKTKDGSLILMHDSTVDRTTNGQGSIEDLTLEEIKTLYLKEELGGDGAALTDEKIPTLEEALMVMKDKVMINLDKAWDVRDDVYDVLIETDTLDQAMFKSEASNAVVEEWLDSKEQRPYYGALISGNSIDDLDNLLDGARPNVFELVFEKDSEMAFSEEVLQKLRGESRIFVNTLWDSISGGRGDDPTGWASLKVKGVNMIQTDSPGDLVKFLNNYKRNVIQTKPPFEKINAINVYDQKGIKGVKNSADITTEIGYVHDGDYAVYKNVVFTPKSIKFKALVSSTKGRGGTIEVTLDELDGRIIGKCDIEPTGGFNDWKIVECPIQGATGKHDVYLNFKGDIDESLFNIDWFKFDNDKAEITPPYKKVEAENFDAEKGIKLLRDNKGETTAIGHIYDGDYAVYNNIKFTPNSTMFQVMVSSTKGRGGNIEIRLDSLNGPIIGACEVGSTGGWDIWETVECPVDRTTGTHDVYLKFQGNIDESLFNIDWFKFKKN